ncbi:MAG: acylphosphatase [Planctomycetota bacterium]
MIGKTAYYTGRVQGVGFRATTAAIARGFDVAGTVENLEDGRVLVNLEGEAEQVRGFLEAMDTELGRHFRDAQVQDRTTTGEFGDPKALDAFRVKY